MFCKSPNIKFLALTLIACVILQPVAASAQEARVKSAAVVPRMDGDADDESRDLAEALSELLRLMTIHRIVDAKAAGEVVDYQVSVDGGGNDEVGMKVASAKEHHFAFRHKKALSEIEEAIELLRGRALDRQGGPEALDAHLTKAMIASSSKKENLIQEALRGALAVDPLLSISDKDYPPSLIETFESVKGEVDEVENGSLSVKSKPAASEVYINGIMQGVTPLEVESLPSGSYSLSVIANRYAPDDRTITVLSGKNLKVKSRLKWAKGLEKKSSKSDSDEVGQSLLLANALKLDRLLLIDADAKEDGVISIRARMVDTQVRAGLKPLSIENVHSEYKHNQVAELANTIADQLDADALADPQGVLDPVGDGDPIVLGKRKKPLTRRPLFWGAIGVAVAGAIAGGIAAAMAGGSNSGRVKVSFE